MHNHATTALAVLMLAALAAGIIYLVRSLRAAERGAEIHAHSDGTVHEHFFGDRPHTHPTFSERYAARIDRILGTRQ